MKPFGFFLLILLFSCKSDNKPENLSEVKLSFTLFHKELFESHIDSIPQKIPHWINSYSPFFELFSSHVIKIGFPDEKRFSILLQSFVADYRMRSVYSDIIHVFQNIEKHNKELEEAFSYVSYYFPKLPIPKIYYYHGGFNQSIIATDSVLGIGLDKYLGASYDNYVKLAIPNYMKQKMTPDYIAIDALRYYLSGMFPFSFEQENVLSKMIYEGKIQYILKHIFPEKHDTLLFGFTEKQLIWCEKSERSMWKFLIDKKKLFSTDFLEIKRYTQDGPFTTTFPRESPARAAVWIGYKIVQQFMENNPTFTLYELTQIKDYHKIVQGSLYNP